MDNSFLHSKKLLLVDDEPELLKMVSAILAGAGFQSLVTAANMKEGVAVTKAEKPDLAILDVMLPDGDGFSLMEQIRAWTDIPVIFLTARDEAADKLAGLGLGADDYIAKPFLPQEFLLRVYAVLRRCYKEDAPVLRLDSCTVDFSRAEVDKSGQILPLTAMEHKLSEFQTLTAKAETVNPRLTALNVELAQVEDEIEKLLNTLTGASAFLMSYANGKIEELDTRRQGLIKEIAALNAESVSPQKIEYLSSHLGNWDNIDFDDRRQVADIILSQVQATAERVSFE